MNTSWIETRTGKQFDFMAQGIEAIDIWDIASALSNECRFGGHCNKFYSVAEHCCHVYDQVLRETKDRAVRLYALLHDGHEAYVKDLMRPLRQLPELQGYNAIAHQIQERVEAAFDLHPSPEGRKLVHDIDLALLRFEAGKLMLNRGENWHWPTGMKTIVMPELPCWIPQRARGEFHGRFIAEYDPM